MCSAAENRHMRRGPLWLVVVNSLPNFPKARDAAKIHCLSVDFLNLNFPHIRLHRGVSRGIYPKPEMQLRFIASIIDFLNLDFPHIRLHQGVFRFHVNSTPKVPPTKIPPHEITTPRNILPTNFSPYQIFSQELRFLLYMLLLKISLAHDYLAIA